MCSAQFELTARCCAMECCAQLRNELQMLYALSSPLGASESKFLMPVTGGIPFEQQPLQLRHLNPLTTLVDAEPRWDLLGAQQNSEQLPGLFESSLRRHMRSGIFPAGTAARPAGAALPDMMLSAPNGHVLLVGEIKVSSLTARCPRCCCWCRLAHMYMVCVLLCECRKSFCSSKLGRTWPIL